MGPENFVHSECIARKCAQIKQIIRLSKCEHHPSAIYTIIGKSRDWVQYCVDCGKVICQG